MRLPPLDGLVDQKSRLNQFLNLLIGSVFAAVALIGLLISAAGTYSLMSFTVSRRSREIAIRTALGASPRRILWAIFSRAFMQIGLGVVAGSVSLILLLDASSGSGPADSTSGLEQLGAALTVVAVMTFMGFSRAACPRVVHSESSPPRRSKMLDKPTANTALRACPGGVS